MRQLEPHLQILDRSIRPVHQRQQRSLVRIVNNQSLHIRITAYDVLRRIPGLDAETDQFCRRGVEVNRIVKVFRTAPGERHLLEAGLHVGVPSQRTHGKGLTLTHRVHGHRRTAVLPLAEHLGRCGDEFLLHADCGNLLPVHRNRPNRLCQRQLQQGPHNVQVLLGRATLEPQQFHHARLRFAKLIEMADTRRCIKNTAPLHPSLQTPHCPVIDPFPGKVHHIILLEVAIDDVILGNEFHPMLPVPQGQVEHLLILATNGLLQPRRLILGVATLAQKRIVFRVHRKT